LFIIILISELFVRHFIFELVIEIKQNLMCPLIIKSLSQSGPFIHDLILEFVTWVTRRVPHVEQARTAYPSRLLIRISYWNKTKPYVSISNKCYIYFRFSEIRAWRQVCIQFQSLTIWIHKLGGHGCDKIVIGK
jgi:hypothetical protein